MTNLDLKMKDHGRDSACWRNASAMGAHISPSEACIVYYTGVLKGLNTHPISRCALSVETRFGFNTHTHDERTLTLTIPLETLAVKPTHDDMA